MGKTGAPRRFDHEAIRADYHSGLSLSQVALRHGCSLSCVWKILRATQSTRARTTGVCDHGFFARIDTEEKAYWAGFLLADGFVTQNRINVSVKAEDAEHLEKFRLAIRARNPVAIYNQAQEAYSRGKQFAVFGVASSDRKSSRLNSSHVSISYAV